MIHNLLVASLLFLSCVAHGAPSVSVAHTPQMRQVLTHYVTSGLYDADIREALVPAWSHLKDCIEQRKDAELAIVLDVDETSLSNYHDLARLSFSRNMEAVAGAYMLSQAPALQPTLELYQYATEQGIHIFFVTGRPKTPEISERTRSNLEKAGYHTFTDLFLMPIHEQSIDRVAYKSDARRQITEMGYEIILNIGDQYTDLDGGYSELSVKLPNPFYKTL